MRNQTISALTLLLLPLALPAQHSPNLPQVPGAPQQPEFVDISKGSGLQVDGPNKLLGNGTDYLAWFSDVGMRFVPALGSAAKETRYVSLRPTEVRRGEQVIGDGFETVPTQQRKRAQYQRGAMMSERYDVCDNGVEVSWQFDEQPAGSGDLVVRYQVDTNLPLNTHSDDGLQFVQPGLGGVSIGGVTGIDADGERVTGALSFANGMLEMSLPEAFVDGASYPIILDPLVGTVIQVSTNNTVDDEPDAAYDGSTQTFLVAWRQTFSTGLVVPRARLVDLQGSLLASTIVLNSTGVSGRPRVANHSFTGRFGVVFEEQVGSFQGIQFRAISAATGLITHSTVLASSTGIGLFRHPDIGGSGNTTNIRAFVAVWEDNIADVIRARRIYFDGADNLVVPSPVSVFTDSSGPLSSNTYSMPAMSRQASTGHSFMVVARRDSGVGPSRIISGKIIDSGTLATIASTSFELTSTDDLTNPDVDGANGSWMVAWARELGSSSITKVEHMAAHYDGSSWTLGPITSFGSTFQDVESPTVGWSQARTWLGYHQTSGIGSQKSLRLRSLDTASGATCASEFTQNLSSADRRIVVATDFSGGTNGGSLALAAFAQSNTVYVQRLINYGPNGTFTSLGGQCGNGGLQYFSHAPGIGSSIVCGINGLNPSAVLTVFNMTTDQTPIVCGLCEWAPFAITSSEIPVGGTAAVGFAIPCLPNLIGSQFITQWTSLDPGQGGCALAPHFVTTDRSLMTLGN